MPRRGRYQERLRVEDPIPGTGGSSAACTRVPDDTAKTALEFCEAVLGQAPEGHVVSLMPAASEATAASQRVREAIALFVALRLPVACSALHGSCSQRQRVRAHACHQASRRQSWLQLLTREAAWRVRSLLSPSSRQIHPRSGDPPGASAQQAHTDRR